MKRKTRTFTPIDLFVQTYAMDHGRTYIYHPGVDVNFKTSMMSQEDIEALLEAVKSQGLRVHFQGELYIYEPDDDTDEEPETEAPEETDHQPEPTPDEIEKIERESNRIAEKMRELEPVVEENPDEEAVEIEDDEEPEEALEI